MFTFEPVNKRHCDFQAAAKKQAEMEEIQERERVESLKQQEDAIKEVTLGHLSFGKEFSLSWFQGLWVVGHVHHFYHQNLFFIH